MARALLKDTCEIAGWIIAGDQDANLDWIEQACKARRKMLWRLGAKVRLVGTSDPSLNGKVGTIIKVNAKTVTVGLGDPEITQWGTYWPEGEYNVPPQMLQPVE